MKTPDRLIDRFVYKHPNFGIPGLMKYIAIGNVIVYLLDVVTQGWATVWLMFHPTLILHGQVWRLVTFLFIPVSGYSRSLLSPLWFALSVLFYYWIGNALENQWGTARFNVFYFLGALLNVAIGFLFQTAVSMYYINMSMFFAYATLYPDMQVLLYGILPLKVKWLAWFDAALFAFSIVRSLLAGSWIGAVLPIIALLNYFIFFWSDLAGLLGRGRDRAAHRHSAQTINFKKAQKELQQRRGYLHKCAVCGVTDADDPDMEFRYCSKCAGYYCYCANHINNHQHVQ